MNRRNVEEFEARLIAAGDRWIAADAAEVREVEDYEADFIKLTAEAGLTDDWWDDRASYKWTTAEFVEEAMNHLGIYWEQNDGA
jgi:hypothetical protein